jgi:hypothetical protein
MCINKLEQTHIQPLQIWLTVDAIHLGIHHQTALQQLEPAKMRHILIYTDFLLVEHECLQGRNCLEKKSEIPSQEVLDDDTLSFVQMEVKLKMSCNTILNINRMQLKYYTIALMQ